VYQIKKIDTVNAPEEIIEKILDYVEKAVKQYNPEDNLIPRNALKDALRNPYPTQETIKYFAFKGDEVIGEARFSYEKLKVNTNPEYCRMYVRVLKEHTQKGIGTALLSKLAKEANKMKKSRVIAWVRQGAVKHYGKEWVEKIGFRRVMTEYKNVLYPENVNVKKIEQIINEKKEKNKDFSFQVLTEEEYYQRILDDEDFRKEAADFFTETSNLIPRGDTQENDYLITPEDMIKNAQRDLKTKTWSGIIILALKDNKLIGFSETYFSILEKQKPVFYTGKTAVRKEFQGRGIASLLKALMIKELVKRNFSRLETENASTNKVMLHINYKLGFKKIYEFLKYEGTVEQVNAYLNKKKSSHFL